MCSLIKKHRQLTWVDLFGGRMKQLAKYNCEFSTAKWSTRKQFIIQPKNIRRRRYCLVLGLSFGSQSDEFWGVILAVETLSWLNGLSTGPFKILVQFGSTGFWIFILFLLIFYLSKLKRVLTKLLQKLREQLTCNFQFHAILLSKKQK